MDLDELINKLPAAEQEKLFQQVTEYREAIVREKAQKSFMAFVKEMWPGFIHGRHHALMAKKFEEIAEGKLKRLIINMPPRHTKSEFASYLLPAWFLGRYPNKKVIQTSNTAELAVGFGRKVRNLVGSDIYTKMFPGVGLRADSKAAGRWATSHGGDYFAIGVGGTVTGKGADLLIIDDPHSEQEARQAQGDPGVFDSVYEWYTSGPRQRLQPGGAIVLVMCMTGDTRVLLANGLEKELRSIKVGDEVATYDSGKITTSKVLNWQSNGFDFTYRITTNFGKIVYANERHPFLVDNNGVRQWIRLKDLKEGMLLVATRTVEDPHEHKQDREDFVPHAKQHAHTTRSCSVPQNTYEIILEEITDVTPYGYEEVFDVEIERTENFIANGLVSHNTRWSDKDLTGRVLKNDLADWEVIELPAILPSGNSLWPEFWSIDELTALKEELPSFKWNAQYQQKPTGDEGAIVKREWWRRWEKERPPRCEFIIQSWDTAFTKSQRADYSACTTWGVFYLNENESDVHIILLDSWKDKVEFPDLKVAAKQFYDEWEPDSCIIEAKAAGTPLILELRRMGVMVQDFTPTRGNDKFVRLNSVTDLFSSGKVWAPETRWADEVIEEFARFPNAEHDDLVDSGVQALIRFRQGGFLRLASDEQDEIVNFRRKAAYY